MQIGYTIQTVGEVLVGLTVIMVHHRVLDEHRIDRKVLRILRKEQLIGGLAIVMIITGYILHMNQI
jgi:hypothetical protein